MPQFKDVKLTDAELEILLEAIELYTKSYNQRGQRTPRADALKGDLEDYLHGGTPR